MPEDYDDSCPFGSKGMHLAVLTTKPSKKQTTPTTTTTTTTIGLSYFTSNHLLENENK